MMLCIDGSDIASLVLALTVREDTILRVVCEQELPRQLGDELRVIEAFLAAQKSSSSAIDAVGLVVGPGSSGALRSTLSFVNAWALGRGLGVCEVVKLGRNEVGKQGVERPASGRMNGGWGVVTSEKPFVLPVYERSAHTTPSDKDILGRRISAKHV